MNEECARLSTLRDRHWLFTKIYTASALILCVVVMFLGTRIPTALFDAACIAFLVSQARLAARPLSNGEANATHLRQAYKSLRNDALFWIVCITIFWVRWVYHPDYGPRLCPTALGFTNWFTMHDVLVKATQNAAGDNTGAEHATNEVGAPHDAL
ncbi:hypothetical protein GGQ74_000137 [Desulfobaculum xiamenense]|uniref:Uncharacterized protein n=1 Tax=Desulfobaculum xiamenense TaxID=995050 RepID=A0A846QHK2_9BACT|nr:hypothetical protein [Desulfobaculum xiamenense]NJB66497.1 hypothetical protein [Desulfobaculum xiamenense]